MRPACLLANIAAFAMTISLLWASRATAAVATASTYRLDTYALQLNGETQFVSSLDGGFIDGTVVTETGGAMPKKHIGGTTIEPVRARVRPDQFTQFLADSLDGKADNATGTIYYIDNGGKVQQQRALSGLMLSELAFPTLAGSSRAATQLTITLAAQSSLATDPLAGALPPVKNDAGPRVRNSQWVGDFQLQIPGLPTNRVSTIEAFTIRRKLASGATGQGQQPAAAAPWEIPNLVLYCVPQDSQAWIAWHDDFVVKGNNSDAQEKTLTLDLLVPDRKQAVLELQGSGVGIVSAKYEQPVGATTSIQGFRVELYVESMKIVTNSMAPSVMLAPPTVVDTISPKSTTPTSRPMPTDLNGTRLPQR
jgi:hypothetical protein